MLMLPFDARSHPPLALLDHRDSSPHRPALDHLLRAADVVIAAILIVGLSPLLLLIALAIGLADGGAPLFAQQRLGQHGRLFACWKFRTMVIDADARLADLRASPDWHHRHKLPADPRVTALGRLLRRSSIDELPQLANVILGDMSLVGSRPIVAAEVARYGRHFADYIRQRPGLSGLWQVSGRSTTSYPRRLACDRLFARRRSPVLYARILIATIPTVLFGRGAC